MFQPFGGLTVYGAEGLLGGSGVGIHKLQRKYWLRIHCLRI